MLTLPVAAALHLERESRRLTVCGVVYRRDGLAIRCTQHDEDLEIAAGDLAGTYFASVPVTASDIKSSADLSVDNMEIAGAITDQFSITGFTVADIEAGLFNNAPFETFLCQWDDPGAWQKSLRRGYLGEISRTAEGAFQCEWRGIVQVLQQMVGRTYAELCDVKRFGDARCGLNVDVLQVTGTVSAVTSSRRFDLALGALPSVPVPDLIFFDLGDCTFNTGNNHGYSRQIKRGAAGGSLGQIDLWESMPATVNIGDTVTLRPGCDRRFERCQYFQNTDNFRGHGRWIPGIPNIIRAP